MQAPRHATIPALHLRDARDAHIVFEAVRLNILPLITRRLTAQERDQLESGNVFVWEEAEHKQGGLERWTDGRRWSQSRMRGDYLFYEEKIETTPEEKAAKAARRARRTLDPFAYQPAPTRQDRPSKPDGLTKQTYSTHVCVPGGEPRKWHVVAYFSGDDYNALPVVEDYEYLRNVRVPEGVYASAKGNLTRAGGARALAAAPSLGGDDGQDWLPPWPASPVSAASPSSDRPYSSNSSSSASSHGSGSMSPGSPYPLAHTPFAMSRHPSAADGAGALPRLSNIVPALPLPAPGAAPPGYAGLTAEDKRALNSFRIAL